MLFQRICADSLRYTFVCSHKLAALLYLHAAIHHCSVDNDMHTPVHLSAEADPSTVVHMCIGNLKGIIAHIGLPAVSR